MFGKKATREDVEQYIASIMLPGETNEASHIGGYDPLEFVAVTSYRFIGTETTQTGNPIIRSIPFNRVAAVSVTDDRQEPQLGHGRVNYLMVHGDGDVGRLTISGRQEAAALYTVYRVLAAKVFGSA